MKIVENRPPGGGASSWGYRPFFRNENYPLRAAPQIVAELSLDDLVCAKTLKKSGFSLKILAKKTQKKGFSLKILRLCYEQSQSKVILLPQIQTF